MVLEHYYWYFQSAIPHRVRDDIVKYGQLSKKKEILGLTGELGVDRNAKDKPLSNKEMLNLKSLLKAALQYWIICLMTILCAQYIIMKNGI